MTKILDIIFRNWQAKIISVFLALSLWLYVGIGQTRNDFFPGGLPLQIKNVPEGFVAITDVDRVKVRVVASPDLWKKLSADSFSAYLDLGGLQPGVNEVKVTVISSVGDIQVVETDPAKVLVRIESRIEKEVPVNVLIDGKAGEGLVAGDWKVEPNKVKVNGAKSIVDSLLEATAKISLDGQTADFKKSAKLEGLDSQGKTISNLEFTPKEAIVSVPIIKASNVKTVGIKANIQGTLADGFWISKIEVTPQTVTIAAAEAQIGKINYVLTNAIDISNVNKSTFFEVPLKPDAGISILDSVDKVKVELFITKSQSTKEIETGFKWQGSNLNVVSVEPTTVKVVVSGPSDKLATLTASDISLIIDLSSTKDIPGTYSIDISRSNISGPSGISVSSIVPSAISVRVDTK